MAMTVLGLCWVLAFLSSQAAAKIVADVSDDQYTQESDVSLSQYEIVYPALVDDRGNFLSYSVDDNTVQNLRRRRYRRDAHNTFDDFTSQRVFYRLSGYGHVFQLNLSKVPAYAPTVTLERWKDGAPVEKTSLPMSCQYAGSLAGHNRSAAAVSNCRGLHGMISTESEDYFVEPLSSVTPPPDSDYRGLPHILYRRASVLQNHGDAPSCGTSNKRAYQKKKHKRSKLRPGHQNKKLRHLKRRQWAKFRRKEKRQQLLGNKRKRGFLKGKHRGRPKRSVSQDNYIETLLVAGPLMVRRHGADLSSYLLTLANIVARLYSDETTGNSVTFVVKRIIILENDDPTLRLSHHAGSVLASFCQWQQQLLLGASNAITPDDQDSLEHDAAIFITRYDICEHMNRPCDTVGLAPIGGMCDPSRSCTVVEDIGLASAFTMAHELGHTLGMYHDGVDDDCGRARPGGIMSQQLTAASNAFKWSPCSRDDLTKFLDSGSAECLRNIPSSQVQLTQSYSTLLIQRSADEQCKLQYGTTSRHCRFGALQFEVCRELWCINDSGKCVTNSFPAADGTECYINRLISGRCVRGSCEQNYRQGPPVDGVWGAWSEWSSCSRTCGGGVSSRLRYCNNPGPANGGKYCLGERRRYKACNIESCSEESESFRELQCSRYDGLPFEGRLYRWVPYIPPLGVALDPCSLYCQAAGSGFYTRRAASVEDGTGCLASNTHKKPRSICVAGHCMRVGCDEVLGSTALEDRCRVCQGTGTSCSPVAGVSSSKHLKSGYQKVVIIPEGSVHINITETLHSRNYIAVKSSSSKFYLNGGWQIDWAKRYFFAGTEFVYKQPPFGQETLTALGPITEPLHIMMLVQEKDGGVSYRYNEPIKDHVPPAAAKIYEWSHRKWSGCSHTCGKGLRRAPTVCVNVEKNRTVMPDDMCRAPKPRDLQQACNPEPCPARWDIGPWTNCSTRCGGGWQERRVACMRPSASSAHKEPLPVSQCPGALPKSRQRCNLHNCPPVWRVGRWSKCSALCGAGERMRRIYCVHPTSGRRLPSSRCSATETPPSKTSCSYGACPPPAWVTGEWSKCSAACGRGHERRAVACRDYFSRPSDTCSPHRKPPDWRECEGPCLAPKTKECVDESKVSYCGLVLKFNFCSRPYFKSLCCATCKKHLSGG